ncbi:unnamed protein product [Urochloa humidicola]
MEFATGPFGTLIRKLGKLLKDECDLQKSVKGRIMFLKTELERMHAALEKVSSVSSGKLDKNTRLWARDVRELSYDIEDSIDKFLVGVEGKKSAKPHNIKVFIDSTLNLLYNIMRRHMMATSIKDFECLIKEVKERHDRYNVNNVVPSPVVTPVDPRLHSFYQKVTELVGIEETSVELINLLNNGDDKTKKHLKIISVVGVGGLGKTTLAKAVYDKLKVEFQCCAFVQVGQYPDVKKVLKDILFELDKETYKVVPNLKRDERQLIDLLLEFLKNKRYFIVIDDVWGIPHWKTIKLALVENNLGSRIITTTRIFDVAKEAGVVYRLDALSNENSRQLFYKRIFIGQGLCRDNEMDDVPDKILKKCGGIPLAIIAMASLLVGKQRDQWFGVYGSISFSHKGNPQVENTKEILAFSYYDMPFHLRTCLLYLSVFPEDYIINKYQLIWMWIAEGFVYANQQGPGELFELGEAYFNELMNRSMIQPVQDELEHGIIIGCRLHDMVLGLIRSLSCEENFVTIFDDEQNALPEGQVHRLSFQGRTVGNILRVQMGMPRTRSLVCWCSIFHMVPLSSFCVLRVLFLEDCDIIDSDLKHLGDLHHLRYLGLKRMGISKLPDEIASLKYLETLDVSANFFLRELPLSFGLLEQLLCLRSVVFPAGIIGKLTSLVELQTPAPKDSEAASKYFTEIGNLKELRVLKIENQYSKLHASAVDALLESVSNMHKLRHLQTDVRSNVLPRREVLGYVPPRHLQHLQLAFIKFPSLPTWISSFNLPGLTTLSLRVKHLSCSEMRTLGRLPELCSLQLWAGSNLLAYGGAGYFQKLTNLKLFSPLAIFRRDKSGAPVMPSLETLELGISVRKSTDTCFCQSQDISAVPTMIGLHNITSLEKTVVLLYCPHVIHTEVEEMEEAFSYTARSQPDYPTVQITRVAYKEISIFDRGLQMDEREFLDFPVQVLALRDIGFGFNFKNLPFLEHIIARIYCEYATAVEVLKAEEALRHAMDVHPNHPTIEIERYNEDEMDKSCSTLDEQPNHVATAQNVEDAAASVAVTAVVDQEAEEEVSTIYQDVQSTEHDATTQNQEDNAAATAASEESASEKATDALLHR